MKTTFALVGAYAALASAFTPGRHLHFPRSNGTTTTAAPSPQGPLTTLTVKETRTSTIISCSSTVTNCPAGPGITAVPESDRETKIVTQTVDLTTIVCPVSEASTISDKIISQHKSTSSLLPSQTAPIANVTATGSPTPVGPLTTLTVKETRTSTIISCSSTVTNCPVGPGITAVPESDRETKVVTQTVDLTTIVCPVSEASTISDKIISQHKSDSSLLPGKTQVPVQTTDIVITKTITLTKGTGDNKTLVPSVITSTIKSTISPPAAGSKPSDATVTTTATSTSTKTVTITRAKATPTGTSPANGNGGDNGNEKCVSGAAPATVTVTVAQTTVTASASTVTVTASCEASAAPGDSKKKVDNKPGDNKPVNNGSKPVDNGSKPSKPADAEATPCETDGTTTIEATVTVVPYPANNSTIVTATGAPGPSGFARLRR
ncbi:hypothetical protein MY5147_006728 [Beauveria neobassiana]|uniref:Uncharacterized protein n=1 Tax=Beauveria bassiana TaxID=176275 RepID=A0A2S7YDM1_BEABA|nr:hypothetical protein BB8028_0004g10440 [Beauveria bassiana]